MIFLQLILAAEAAVVLKDQISVLIYHANLEIKCHIDVGHWAWVNDDKHTYMPKKKKYLDGEKILLE